MKEMLIVYQVALGIIWETAYVIVIIGIGIIFAYATQLIR